MLRVSYSETAEGQRWKLYGRLAGAWVDELRSCWAETRKRTPLARAVVDLKDVVFIDEAGERLLAEMETSGTELLASGVENQHVVAVLKNGPAAFLRRSLKDLCAPKERTTPKGEEK